VNTFSLAIFEKKLVFHKGKAIKHVFFQ